MRLKILLILLLSCLAAKAQQTFLSRQTRKIDSLILYSRFPEAEKELRVLENRLTILDKDNFYREAQVSILMFKADILLEKKEWAKALIPTLNAIELAQEYRLPEKEYNAYLTAALINEISEELDLCKSYLDRAEVRYKENRLENKFSTLCIRKSSYFNLLNNNDSLLYYARKGLRYAVKYSNLKDTNDACLLLGSFLPKEQDKEALKFNSRSARIFLKRNIPSAASTRYIAMARRYVRNNEMGKAFVCNDSARYYSSGDISSYSYKAFLKQRSELFAAAGNTDSAFFYYKIYHDSDVASLKKQEALGIKAINEKYQNEKKETQLKDKDEQLLLIASLLVVTTIGALLIVRKNRKINKQHKIINAQMSELGKTLEQKQVLLSELQHRVKNNMQHVISILEMQKESADFNSVNELIRENLNRMQSMALLHKKLNVSENANEIDLKVYLLELSELVKESYDDPKKQILLDLECDVSKISIQKALPVGLIIVELVSNSMKHAFTNQKIGKISISIAHDNHIKCCQLHYSDNGKGFDFDTTSNKGLGVEIIKGLIGQLGGTYESNQINGFDLIINFK